MGITECFAIDFRIVLVKILCEEFREIFTIIFVVVVEIVVIAKFRSDSYRFNFGLYNILYMYEQSCEYIYNKLNYM